MTSDLNTKDTRQFVVPSTLSALQTKSLAIVREISALKGLLRKFEADAYQKMAEDLRTFGDHFWSFNRMFNEYFNIMIQTFKDSQRAAALRILRSQSKLHEDAGDTVTTWLNLEVNDTEVPELAASAHVRFSKKVLQGLEALEATFQPMCAANSEEFISGVGNLLN